MAGKLKCDLKGVVLVDAWISPIDSTMSWAPYLYATSMIDDEGYKKINQAALATKKAVENGQWSLATELWSKTQRVITRVADEVDWYNILKKEPLPMEALGVLMNGPVKKALKIPAARTFGQQSYQVFNESIGDFMKPVISTVDDLLDLGYKVVVFNGQLDLIVDTIGTNVWVQKLKWNGLKHWNKAPRKPLYNAGKRPLTGAFVKEYKNFSYYWIMRSGHMVPKDQPEMGRRMLKMITEQCGMFHQY